MATDKQIEANRLNAQRSTGPRSAEGKARSRFNALQSGIDAESILLPGEDPAALEVLRAEYYEHHQPITPDERDTLECVIHAVCLMRRFRVLEAQLVQHELANTPDLDPSAPLGHIFSNASHKFVRLQTRMNSAERSFHRGLDRLDRLKSQRPPLDASGTGIPACVSSEPPPQAPETKPETPKLASFPETPSNPESHPTDPADCPHCRRVGYISQKCPYLQRAAWAAASLRSHPS